MRIDLHTHSDQSDGTDSPSQVVHKAVEAGLDVVALTDHDDTSGWDEAARAAEASDITLVRGLEISATYEGKSIHLLGYNVDAGHAGLRAELDAILEGRSDRVPKMVRVFQDLGIDLTVEEIERWSDNASATGRPHVADALVAKGVVADRSEAFERYLKPGRPAFIDRYATEVFRAVELVLAAGGIPVLAHPWSRGSDEVMTADVIARLTEAGLSGLEVDHNDHDEAARGQLRQIAADNDLAVTGSSDFHGAGKVGYDLGCNTTAVAEYERLFGE